MKTIAVTKHTYYTGQRGAECRSTPRVGLGGNKEKKNIKNQPSRLPLYIAYSRCWQRHIYRFFLLVVSTFQYHYIFS